jgi:hypothetical protein
MMRDAGTYGLIFSSSPPYELLSSRTFSIEDILFCDRFATTFDYLSTNMSAELLDRLGRLAGRLSTLVQLVMDSGVVLEPQNTDALRRVLAGLMTRDRALVSSA